MWMALLGLTYVVKLAVRKAIFGVFGGLRKRASRWTAGYVKLSLSPRHSRGIIPTPADQCAGVLGGVSAGHQPKGVAALMTSGMAARVEQRSLSAASRSSRVVK